MFKCTVIPWMHYLMNYQNIATTWVKTGSDIIRFWLHHGSFNDKNAADWYHTFEFSSFFS